MAMLFLTTVGIVYAQGQGVAGQDAAGQEAAMQGATTQGAAGQAGPDMGNMGGTAETSGTPEDDIIDGDFREV